MVRKVTQLMLNKNKTNWRFAIRKIEVTGKKIKYSSKISKHDCINNDPIFPQAYLYIIISVYIYHNHHILEIYITQYSQ